MAEDVLLSKSSVSRQEADFKTVPFVLGAGGALNTEHNALTPIHGLREVFFSPCGSGNNSPWVWSWPSAGDGRPHGTAPSHWWVPQGYLQEPTELRLHSPEHLGRQRAGIVHGQRGDVV